MTTSLHRRAAAELVGTGLLVTVVVGSGIAAQTLSTDVGIRLLENAVATAAGLFVLILMFGPVSGGHFNPVVSVADWFLGRREGFGLCGLDTVWYVGAQTVGAIAGTVLADAMFAKPLVQWSTRDRSSGHLWLGEVVATSGLLLLIFALARSGRSGSAPAAVGAYIGAAYWFTSSTSFANPSVTIARAFTNTFAGISPGSVPGFIGAQIVGLAIGVAAILTFYPHAGRAADEVVVPHEPESTKDVAMSDRPSILFACRKNAGRSVAAKVLAEHYGGSAVEVRSAGSTPGEHVHPEVAAVLAERGLSTEAERPKLLDLGLVEAADVVVTMGCGEECPYVPGKRYVDWEVDDPAGQDVAAVRAIVDDIDSRVRALLRELVPGHAQPVAATTRVPG
jgi:arsenate reductase (thioredoxin)